MRIHRLTAKKLMENSKEGVKWDHPPLGLDFDRLIDIAAEAQQLRMDRANTKRARGPFPLSPVPSLYPSLQPAISTGTDLPNSSIGTQSGPITADPNRLSPREVPCSKRTQVTNRLRPRDEAKKMGAFNPICCHWKLKCCNFISSLVNIT